MRINEFIHGPTNTPESNLLTALALLRNRYKDIPTPAKISTQSLINMILNTDRTFNYEALVSANENNPAVKNLIKSFNRKYVELQPWGDEEPDEVDTTTNVDDETLDTPVDTVDDMAKRAAKTRGAPISDLN
jgi:hypothetical protein